MPTKADVVTELLARPHDVAAALLERVVIGGDLSKLTPAERLEYYQHVCRSVGLNPLTRPLEYLHLNGKLVLYARRDATDQLRKLHAVSVERLEREVVEGVYVVTVYVRTEAGRTDSDLGAVPIDGLKGEARANAMLKAVTKAKRRATLSICGLGMLDETELETIPAAALAAAETEPESGRQEIPVEPPIPMAEWRHSFQAATKDTVEALWRGVRLPDVWRTLTVADQVELGALYNATKKRLGLA
jgi:hypothetical protein